MATQNQLFQAISYEEAADFLAGAALAHSGEKPILSGVYGLPTTEKKRFPRAVDDRIIALRGMRLVHVLNLDCDNAEDLSRKYRWVKDNIPACDFPLILIPFFDLSCSGVRYSFVDLLTAEVFNTFPEFTLLMRDPEDERLEPTEEIVKCAIARRARYAVRFDIPFTKNPSAHTSFLVITP